MLNVLKVAEEQGKWLDEIAPQSWVHAVAPTTDEISQLHNIGIPAELLSHVLDLNERSRVIRRDEVVLIVVRFPHRQEQTEEIPYITVPVSIILLPGFIVTIEPLEIGLFESLKEIQPSGTTSGDGTQFVMSLLLSAASGYLNCLQTINEEVEETEDRLKRSLRNREVLELLNFQKSLVYFSTALNSIETMLEKLQKGDFLEWSPENHQLGEDSLIEIRQAMYQVDIAGNILTQMMDAFASIVSNNLNTVMKFLAAITIVISVPMLIASLYGMNVPLPGESQVSSFTIILALSFLLSLSVVILFWKMDWL